MRRHLEGIDLATTPALLRRATPGKYLVRLSAWCYNSRSPAENDGMCYTLMTRDNTRYNSRSLLRRATPLAVEPLDDALATTHALLRRATSPCEARLSYARLQLTLSCRERRSHTENSGNAVSLQLTLSCGERPQHWGYYTQMERLQLTLSCGERRQYLRRRYA